MVFALMKLPRVILASSSPRRRELLRQIGVECEVIAPHIDETPRAGESPAALVKRLSLAKANAVAVKVRRGVVLGADTVVVLDGAMLGKPANAAEARAMLRRLSGRAHAVYSGFAVVDVENGRALKGYETAKVTFRRLAGDEIVAYVASGSPLDKAGAYGIQADLGAVFIEKISGDYYSVVGLPLMRVYLALREMTQ
jgi:septum formation protein